MTNQEQKKQEPQSVGSTTQTITKFGLLSCGGIHCSVELLSPKLVPGQQAKILVSVSNDSTTVVKGIGMVLKQKSHYFAGPEDAKATKDAHPKEISKSLWRMNVPVEKETVEKKENEERYTIKLPPLPDRVLNTFRSDNHYVRHQLKVTLITEMNHSNVVLKMPVTVGPAKSGGVVRASMTIRDSVKMRSSDTPTVASSIRLSR